MTSLSKVNPKIIQAGQKLFHQAIVEQLNKKLKSPTIMLHPDFDHPFVVHFDDNEKGLGADFFSEAKWKIECY